MRDCRSLDKSLNCKQLLEFQPEAPSTVLRPGWKSRPRNGDCTRRLTNRAIIPHAALAASICAARKGDSQAAVRFHLGVDTAEPFEIEAGRNRNQGLEKMTAGPLSMVEPSSVRGATRRPPLRPLRPLLRWSSACLLLAALLAAAPLSSQERSGSQERPGSQDRSAYASALGEHLPLLTRAEQVRQLTREEAEQGYPVRLRAVVTYFVPGNDLFVQDASAGIWIEVGDGSVSLHPGQLVQVEGVSSAPDFAPQISKPKIKMLGEAPLPRAKPLTYDRLASGAEDSQWVEVEGIVHLAAIDN